MMRLSVLRFACTLGVHIRIPIKKKHNLAVILLFWRRERDSSIHGRNFHLSLASVCSHSVRIQPTTASKTTFVSSPTGSTRWLCHRTVSPNRATLRLHSWSSYSNPNKKEASPCGNTSFLAERGIRPFTDETVHRTVSPNRAALRLHSWGSYSNPK